METHVGPIAKGLKSLEFYPFELEQQRPLSYKAGSSEGSALGSGDDSHITRGRFVCKERMLYPGVRPYGTQDIVWGVGFRSSGGSGAGERPFAVY